LAILMVAVIIWGIGDVVYVLYQRLIMPPKYLLNINDIFYTFGAFMAVLIAIEIFINIRLYLETNDFPVQLVIATALMAIARKVIVLDIETVSADYVLAIAVTVLALGVTYWLLHKEHRKNIT
ncbi:MAG: phosphate-starvation-inducible PsiE family protein, partial [Rheinheimera sp.]|nr:phosphate-starvation-inducible PsiE family protein [Rheinheimera sp.]